MTRPVININDLEFMPFGNGEGFQAKFGMIGAHIGAKKLGYNLTVVPPGKKAFPFHNHHVAEEMFFIISGKGELRFGSEVYPVKEGDVIACPPGDASKAHQIKNTSATEELKYLAVSTQEQLEYCEYPDSQKKAMIHIQPGEPGKMPKFQRFMFEKEANQGDYWRGEK